jgi:hypothetical protein
MSARPKWHLDCSNTDGARDTGDDNITSCSQFLVTGVRTVTGNKATQSSHAASPIFFASARGYRLYRRICYYKPSFGICLLFQLLFVDTCFLRSAF